MFAHACHASGQCFDNLPHVHVHPRRMPSTEKRKKDKEDKESKKSKKSKKDDGGERDFQKQTKKVVKKLLDDQDPKYLTFQDVREVVKDQVLGGEEPENLAKFNAVVDSVVSHYHRKAAEATSPQKRKPVLRPILKKD